VDCATLVADEFFQLILFELQHDHLPTTGFKNRYASLPSIRLKIGQNQPKPPFVNDGVVPGRYGTGARGKEGGSLPQLQFAQMLQ
jgi:hypothetical protein